MVWYKEYCEKCRGFTYHEPHLEDNVDNPNTYSLCCRCEGWSKFKEDEE